MRPMTFLDPGAFIDTNPTENDNLRVIARDSPGIGQVQSV